MPNSFTYHQWLPLHYTTAEFPWRQVWPAKSKIFTALALCRKKLSTPDSEPRLASSLVTFSYIKDKFWMCSYRKFHSCYSVHSSFQISCSIHAQECKTGMQVDFLRFLISYFLLSSFPTWHARRGKTTIIHARFKSI